MVHAYALLLGVFGKLFVKRLGKTEFELTGIGFLRGWIRDLIAVFQSGLQPNPLCIFGSIHRFLCCFCTSDTSPQLRVGCDNVARHDF